MTSINALFIGPAPPSLWENTVIHQITEISELRPHETAVRDYEDQLTSFAGLMAKANSIANELQGVGIQRHDRVAVLLEPTNSWIASIIGVMTLGAVYVPLDMSLPWQRLTDMVNDCSPKVIIVDQNSKQHQDHFLRPDLTAINISSISTCDLKIPVTADENDAAAILYTSGTSGTPKGIILGHKGLRNFVEPVPQLYNLGPSEVVLQQTSSSFDMSLSQIFKALCHGWSLSILPRELRGDALAISRTIRRHNVTVTVATPSEYSSWLGYGGEDLHASSQWKTAFCGGEPVTEALQSQFRSLPLKHIRIYNHYGPTETTFAATSTEISLHTQENKRFSEDPEMETASAGFPLPGYAVYVLDDQMRPLPAGVQGEIYIGGAGVGHGYLNRPSLSSERFVADIFASQEERARGWTTLHRTGDVGRWNAKGALMIEGRKARDSQVKLRGIRVDLEEIENSILSEGGDIIHQVVVTVRQQNRTAGSAFLVAHVVLSDGNRIESEQHQLLSELLSRLRLTLPQYMCPSAIMAVKQLPMTNAAKLDRTAAMSLPLNVAAIDKQQLDANKKALTATEERLLLVWEDVLPSLLASMNREGVITSATDFFHAGGTSMLLLGLQARIRSVFSVELSLIHMFESSTLGSMGRMIDQHMGDQRYESPVVPGESKTVDDLEIDWDEETKLPKLLANSISEPKASPRNEGLSRKVVVLTGATGLLGRGLLDAMIKDDSVDQIHCIAVRNASSREDLLQLGKVVVHEGDLADIRLGLSEQVAKDIFGKADIVIHNGADVSYLKSYASLRACNVLSTKKLAELCAPRMIPFHYVSTMSVGHVVTESIAKSGSSSDRKDEQLAPASVSAHPPVLGTQSVCGADDSRYAARGYTASKWASERFLEQLKGEFPEWDVVIHRPGLILPQEQDAQPEHDRDIGLGIVQNITHYATLLHAIPAIDNESRMSSVTTHLVPLDVVVKDLLAASVHILGDHQESSQHVKFVHQTDGEPLSLEALRQIVAQNLSSASDSADELEGGSKAEITKMDLAEWALRAGEAGMHRTLVEMLMSLSG
jgi:amino acid adenylation domain-containing protein